MSEFLAYARQVIGEDDIAAVAEVLRGDWLTTGPAVEAFEAALAEAVGAKHAIVCNSGTAALYIAARAADLKEGDAVIVPSITFLATASANVLAGLEVVFADVDPQTGLMGVAEAQAALDRAGGRAKAIYPVHLAGRVQDPMALQAFADANGLVVIEDACHALGTVYGNGFKVGACAHSQASCFSFHPAKTIAMGEGGAVTTNCDALARQAQIMRNHGMTRAGEDFRNRELAFADNGQPNPWYYEASSISHNFRASDINCALGASQLKKLDSFVAARRRLMSLYEEALAPLAPRVQFIPGVPGDAIGWHLCQILADFSGTDRGTVMERLRARGIGTQVHYIPVHLQPFYQARHPGLDLPGAQRFYDRTLSLPLYPAMSGADVRRVADALTEILPA
ncbi:MAG TPA: UDP-4-amino-4,6-dideoxy-N-acetyl-beta-L-altrosamine transaminase [Rhizomicrobium sp.]|nr:UDP-4-amino-4,6-dideoxy-N-acetyl-beta-L-altrosamine transaminase [Rhizomicrobium sp.]